MKKNMGAKVKPFQCYLHFFKVIVNLRMGIYNMQAFNSTWVNSPAWCTIKINIVFSPYHEKFKLSRVFYFVKILQTWVAS